ncbi:hypothetical protein AN391_01478 [Pseudoalteromonas sp. P1-13-1a]|nr:hypothetical protein AN391_01478 [Pseudoalteromonas sp. P1-13-1a]
MKGLQQSLLVWYTTKLSCFNFKGAYSNKELKIKSISSPNNYVL